MAKKTVRKKLPTPKYDSEREQNVLLEKVYTEVKIIGEGHESIVRKIDDVEAQVGLVKMAVMDISGDVKILKDDVRILKKNNEELRTGQEEIKQKLDTVITDHEVRLQKLEITR